MEYEQKLLLKIMAVIFLCGIMLTLSVHCINLYLQPKVIVKIDGKEVYRGSSACVDESSLGSSTHIQINKGFLCLFPGPKYTSNHVEIKPILN